MHTRNIITISNPNDFQYGDYELIQSKYKTNRKWIKIHSLSKINENQCVWIRAHLNKVRGTSKLAFLSLRSELSIIQGVLRVNSEEDNLHISRQMIKYIKKIPPESVVDVYGKIKVTTEEISSATQKDIELELYKVFVVSASLPILPFQIHDANQKDDNENFAIVSMSQRLDNRWIDIRTNAKQAIFRIQSAVCRYFREFMYDEDFLEIHTPKIINGVSEGGSEVFKLNYFGNIACLAQSPQLYKQMSVMCDLGKVFEIGPVFRAENSLTHRHLCEFTGLDFEMPINEHYDEVLDVLGRLFSFIFNKLNDNYIHELHVVNTQFPFEPVKYLTSDNKILILEFTECINKLQIECKRLQSEKITNDKIEELGALVNPNKDFSTSNEKLLGKLIKKEYDVDFYIVKRYPLEARPFYTMLDPNDSNYTNSFDVFLRGEEITSGAQRIHDSDILIKRAIECKMPLDDMEVTGLKSYIDSFKYGAKPHGGAGIGLERLVMLFLGLSNIRNTSLFPRDPRRNAP